MTAIQPAAVSGASALFQQNRNVAEEAQQQQEAQKSVFAEGNRATRIEIGGVEKSGESASPYAQAAAAALQVGGEASSVWAKAEQAGKSQDTTEAVQAMRTQDAAQAGFAIAAHAGQTGAPQKLDMLA